MVVMAVVIDAHIVKFGHSIISGTRLKHVERALWPLSQWGLTSAVWGSGLIYPLLPSCCSRWLQLNVAYQPNMVPMFGTSASFPGFLLDIHVLLSGPVILTDSDHGLSLREKGKSTGNVAPCFGATSVPSRPGFECTWGPSSKCLPRYLE